MFDESDSWTFELSSLPSSLVLRVEDEDDEAGGVGYGWTRRRSTLASCAMLVLGTWVACSKRCWLGAKPASEIGSGMTGRARQASSAPEPGAGWGVAMGVVKCTGGGNSGL